MTDAQRQLLARIDPEIVQTQGAVLDDEWEAATVELSLPTINPAQRDRAVALLTAHRIYMTTDPDARPLVGGSSDTRGRKSTAGELPGGYPVDWYETRHGRQLIGILRSSSSIGLLTGH